MPNPTPQLVSDPLIQAVFDALDAFLAGTTANNATATVTLDGNGTTHTIACSGPTTRYNYTEWNAGTRVNVTPVSASLGPGETVQFAASAVDGSGAAIAGATFTWSLGGVPQGAVDATGLYTAYDDRRDAVDALTVTLRRAARMDCDHDSATPVGATMAGPKVSFSLTGWKEMIKNFNDVGVKIDDKNPDIKNAILPAAQAMIANAQNLAPISTAGSTRSRTTKKKGTVSVQYPPGTLRRSLIATKGPANQRGVFIVARRKIAPYAPWVEFGTSKMTARPFFRPALLQMASTYAADIAPGVKQVIETTAAAGAYHPS